MVKLLEKFCCFRLHTAGMVLGWLGVAGALMPLIISVCAIGFADKIADAMTGAPNDPNQHEKARSMIVILGTIYLCGAIIRGVVCGLLIFGTMKNRHLMLLPWLMLHGIGLALNALSLLASGLAMFASIQNIFAFFISILSFALYYYIYLGIYSLYKRIQADNNAGYEIGRNAAAPVHQNAQPYARYGKV
ncbi:hypothetical protein KR044_003009 [Drosophila immigrans]|nr:hypothetical protein KR044_003009 [Drosophila immigrans]